MRNLLTLVVLLVATTSTLSADWSPEAAARYLDTRQKEWFSWKPALSADGPCVSCHTGMTYLLARPALRRRLNESQPTMYEIGLLDRLRAKVGEKPAGALQSVEAIFSAMFLSREDAPSPSRADVVQTMSVHTQKAFDQLWTLQGGAGASKGGWRWYAANLDPWENAESPFYGASLAAVALTQAPAAYRDTPAVRDHAAALNTYLMESADSRRLHDRLALLLARSFISDSLRQSITTETFNKQAPDGGWTIDALGPWMAHPDAPPSSGTNAYATAFTTVALLRGGVPASDPKLAKALTWLQSRQDPASGAWPAMSMNKRYPDGSMESRFMQDAATAFASLALIEAGR
jgi:squalene-hopene/tetraprenyl-beta-curcumene cyclase